MYCVSDNSTGNNPHGTEQMAALLWQDWSLIWCSGIKFVFRPLKVWQELVCSLLVEYLYSSWQCYPLIGQQDVHISLWVACCWVCVYFLLWRTYGEKCSKSSIHEIFHVNSEKGEEREEKRATAEILNFEILNYLSDFQYFIQYHKNVDKVWKNFISDSLNSTLQYKLIWLHHFQFFVG